MNKALDEMRGTGFSVHVLPGSKFPCGKEYFEQTRRMFGDDNPCGSCVIMHNNWIVGNNAKVYR